MTFEKPTRVRWFMLVMVTLIMIIDSMDRANLGVAGKGIQDEFHFGTQGMGWILSGFTLSYALFQLPWGYVGDRFGPRRVLTIGVLWASLATAATALAPRLAAFTGMNLLTSFFFVRLMVGVGVAAAAPNLSKIVARWMTVGERGLGVSSLSVGTGIAGALAPILIAWLLAYWNWRLPFYLCAGVGIAAAIGWHLYSSEQPQQHPMVNQAELELIEAGRESETGAKRKSPPWAGILSSRSAWLLFLSAACQGYVAYIFFNWFFIYLVRVRGLTLRQGGWWGSTPFIAMIFLAPLGGWVSDRVVRKKGKRRGRQIGAWIGMGLSAAFLFAGGHTTNTTMAILLLATAAGFNLFAQSSYWATCIDLSPHHSGSLSGLMNSCANLGGWVSPILTARVADAFGWTRAIDVGVLVALFGGLLWFAIDAGRSIEEGAASSANSLAAAQSLTEGIR
jgi:MFS transporter, ACS family, glucarate transporter